MTSVNNYTAIELIQALEELEHSGTYDIDLDNEYLMLVYDFIGNPQFISQNFPDSYEDLRNSYDKNKIIDFIGYLGINIGYGGDPDMTRDFKSILSLNAVKNRHTGF